MKTKSLNKISTLTIKPYRTTVKRHGMTQQEEEKMHKEINEVVDIYKTVGDWVIENWRQPIDDPFDVFMTYINDEQRMGIDGLCEQYGEEAVMDYIEQSCIAANH